VIYVLNCNQFWIFHASQPVAHCTAICRCESVSYLCKTHDILTCYNVAILLFVFAHYSDKLKTRFPFILAGLSLSLIGLSLNISTAPNGVKYFGTFFIVMGTYAAVPGAISWYATISCVMTKTNIYAMKAREQSFRPVQERCRHGPPYWHRQLRKSNRN
jgi:hypothetical protein